MNRLGPTRQGLCPFDCWKARPRSLDPNSPFNVLICSWMIEYIWPSVALYSILHDVCWDHQNAFQRSLTCLQTFYYHTIDRLLHLSYKSCCYLDAACRVDNLARRHQAKNFSGSSWKKMQNFIYFHDMKAKVLVSISVKMQNLNFFCSNRIKHCKGYIIIIMDAGCTVM